MTRKTIIAATSAAVMLGSIPMLSSPAEAKTVNVPVPKAAVATAFNAALGSTQIRIHNYGSKKGTSWHQDASYILLPTGSKKPFPIPEYKFEINKIRQLKYYLSDFSTKSIQATVNGSRINLNAYFESQGEEVKAKCVRRLFGKWGECSLKMERDIHLNNSIVTLALTPVAYNGSIAYANADVNFKTDVKIANKLCQAFKGICGWIEGKIKKELTKTIENKAAAELNSSAMKKYVAAKVKNAASIRNHIDPKWKVTKVASQGNNFIVTVERPN